MRLLHALRALCLISFTAMVPWQPSSYDRSVGLFTLAGLGAAYVADWSADDHGTARMTDDGAGLISMWQDRVLGKQLTGTTTQRPTWSATGLGGTNPCITFDGTATYLTAANTTSLPSGSTSFSIWVVVSTTATATTQDIFQFGGTANGTFGQIIKAGTDRVNATNGTTTASSITQAVGPHVFGGIFDASVISGQLDGTVGITGAYTLNTGTTRTRVGASNANTPASFFGGCVNRIVIISPVQSAYIQGQIAGRLAWDTGLQANLTNSYKKAAP